MEYINSFFFVSASVCSNNYRSCDGHTNNAKEMFRATDCNIDSIVGFL